MKAIYCTLTILVASLFTITSTAQNFTCDQLTITSIGPDEFDVNNTLINIQMGGSNMDFINYPYIPVIWDCNGDSVSSGQVFFFGQIGQTTQGYPVSELSADVCYPITVQFVFGNLDFETDTCLLTYDTSALSVQLIKEDEFTLFPNPTAGDVQLNIAEQLIGTNYTLLDATGRDVLTDKIRSASTTLSLESLPAGVYMLRCTGYTRRIVKD